MPHYPTEIEYSDKYFDDCYEYRHVILTKEKMKEIKYIKGCLTEEQWRNLGIQQSKGWVNYCRYEGEPHILLFRRPLGTDPNTGLAPPGTDEKIAAYEKERDAYLNQVNPEINYDEYKEIY